ncbi:AzlC family ABC transporter permease [Cognatishimia sp. 1_MG-2023]|uniref:AzlC family ABC transporter permease n=1 Tax=Cognatishimia sp. 1_MG-2023 TaxID=3062642 RepID=UPI0026E11624|nr:AzlC family ABC transporter permease [Cognatishimia sp. 1_MG-2023]MDO6726102.1 AzlC family ABC transporter permease [Cognatishimia sp. 1_MG-2023]
MAITTTKTAFWQGFRDGLPFVLVLAPFAALFGVVATEAGLNVFETLMFSVAVVAGAAQFTAVQLLSENTPTLIVILSALAVNLRMAMYSASLAPHFGPAPVWQRALAAYVTVDQSFAVSIARFEREPDMTVQQKLAYFFGVIAPVLPNWYLFTLLGAWGGKSVPPELALDFAVPITFLAMIGPMLRSIPHVAAALVSVAGSLIFTFVPFNMGLLIAAVLAMMTGAYAELWFSKRERSDG